MAAPFFWRGIPGRQFDAIVGVSVTFSKPSGGAPNHGADRPRGEESEGGRHHDVQAQQHDDDEDDEHAQQTPAARFAW
jgi:hypothetical protein